MDTTAWGFEIIRCGEGTTVVASDGSVDGHAAFDVVVTPGAGLDLRIEVDLGRAVGYWHPAAGGNRTLPADWAGRTFTSLVSSAPVGCLHDAAGLSLFHWALDELIDELEIRYGVSEEHKTFALELAGRAADHERRIALVTGTESVPLAEAVGALASWLAARLGAAPLPVPDVARQPVYSTWYTFTQDLDQQVVTAEAAFGSELGCRSVFVDDGWQRLAVGRGYAGCGDWVPDVAKFPDLVGFAADVHAHDVGVVLWIAPLLLGPDADAFVGLSAYAPHRVEHLHCHVLDPRFREVREHLAAMCVRLVVDYDLDGLKIDFLEQAMHYRGTPSSGDLDDVGEAMRALLGLIRSELVAVGRGEVAFEFRQPYVSPAIGAFGQILRAGDCPADSVVNRRSIVDARLLSVGQVVHGDMLMWGPNGGPEAVAQQLYGSWFGVPQISMRLADLPAEQSAALSGLLALWQDVAPVVLDGSLSVHGSEHDYDLVRADHPDLSRTVIGRYAPVVVDVESPGEVTLLNATTEASVVLRVADGLTIGSGVVRSASAEPVGPVDSVASAGATGLHEISVPAYGSATLTVERTGTAEA